MYIDKMTPGHTQHSRIPVILLAVITLLLQFSLANATVLSADTVWDKEINLGEDLLIPHGVTLTMRPGTTVKVSPAETTKTDPEFISPLTEITVRGRIIIEGDVNAPVTLTSSESGKGAEWAGILIDGGEALIRNCSIKRADSALYLIDGTLTALNVSLTDNRHGATLLGRKNAASIKNSQIHNNDYGVIIITDAEPVLTGTKIGGNRKKDLWKEDLPVSSDYRPSNQPTNNPPLARIYRDEALLGDTLWQGRVRVDGNLRIPEGSRLLIAPGAIIEFTRKDTNGDGIGENGILIQGMLIAKGTKEKPIIFRSTESNRSMGDWDSVNLMNSDKAENLVENCTFEDAYRGLHFHYSTVKVSSSRFSNNYRGIQFQESSVEILDSDFFANKSAVQGRDSTVQFSGNRLFDNHQGVNFFRNNLLFSANRVSGSLKEGVRIREGSASLSGNEVIANRQGVLLADLFYGTISGNVLANSSETGLAMRNVDNIDVSGNYLGKNGANGLNLQEARAAINGNLFAFNAERGIGIVSFSGDITRNNIIGNGLYAIDLESPEDITADGNWWGGETPAAVVFDKRKDPARGAVKAERLAANPFAFTWPVAELSGNLTLAGEIIFKKAQLVPAKSVLSVAPGTTVRFAANTGLTVNGKLLSIGTKTQPITFTSLADKKSGAWNELVIEQALDSSLSYTIIEYASWGIHGHFTNLTLDHILARHNNGGMRFRSGPVIIRNSVFKNNGIGIRSYMGNATIEDNVITENEIGLFVRERGSGLTVRRNNFFANSDYNIRSGDFNSEDIQATGNWWGSSDPAKTIFDGRQEEGVGKVIFEPFLTKPLELERAGMQ